MTELDQLQKYLDEKNIPYERIDEFKDFVCLTVERHQIIVYYDEEKTLRMFDAICHYGSYGYEEGLLEIMGDIVQSEDDDVEGWLTAQDIIERLEKGEIE